MVALLFFDGECHVKLFFATALSHLTGAMDFWVCTGVTGNALEQRKSDDV